MKLKEIIKRQKQEMHPDRYRFNYILLPIWLFVFAVLVAAVCVLDALDGKKFLPLIIIGVIVALLWLVGLIPLGRKIAKKELEQAFSDYAYLFQKEGACPESAEAFDEELGIKCVLTKDGVQIVYPPRGEAVFEETKADAEFLPWTDALLAFATDNRCRKVRLALVLVDKTKTEEFKQHPFPSEPIFLTLTEELFAAVRGFDLLKLASPDFLYLLAFPKKGMKQILDFGYIRKFR